MRTATAALPPEASCFTTSMLDVVRLMLLDFCSEIFVVRFLLLDFLGLNMQRSEEGNRGVCQSARAFFMRQATNTPRSDTGVFGCVCSGETERSREQPQQFHERGLHQRSGGSEQTLCRLWSG